MCLVGLSECALVSLNVKHGLSHFFKVLSIPIELLAAVVSYVKFFLFKIAAIYNRAVLYS